MDENKLIAIKSKIDNLEQLTQSEVEFLYHELISYKQRYERKSIVHRAVENAANDIFELAATRERNKRQ